MSGTSEISPDALSSADERVGLLRLATAGSVDDGKSTLVGRLLHDSKSVLTDQLEAVTRVSNERGQEEADLALLTDGLRAEREQGITIDVAYRYFATARRRFILADTPGHVQYTRNMVTGASTAELAVVLVDARNGVVEQTRRHAAVAALLRVPHVVLAVNKMDLVDYSEERFAEVANTFTEYAKALGVPDVRSIPVSALRGDNVVDPSSHMDWFSGPTLLEYLETVPVETDPTLEPARFPVQYVLRPQSDDEYRDYRGYAGQVASGVFREGDEVVVLPSGQRTSVAGIDRLGVAVRQARQGESITLRLADDVDISRGDLIAPVDSAPRPTQDIEATVCHVADRPLRTGDRVLLKHTTRTVKAIVKDIAYRLDLNAPIDGVLGHEQHLSELRANDIARVVLRTAQPLALDDYAIGRRTGSFLLIDEADGSTLTAGMAGAAFAAPGRCHS
ncbi:sulfate adenylyltransferase subunit 1 [Embleya scabrispora]|uniref:sulfate adenylyltransferase subunit 1 n=1 Tax=Embleya scabrispora TaxID=159449 RepID=UPI0003AABBEB|nr:GTP-binding protein [Embleya scabrispora]MYS84341.1 sulfate adenylyltransferase [Streptomyces sp. SID5474]